jgi:hypothetical protein
MSERATYGELLRATVSFKGHVRKSVVSVPFVDVEEAANMLTIPRSTLRQIPELKFAAVKIEKT